MLVWCPSDPANPAVRSQVFSFSPSGIRADMALVLWILAVILVVAGILALFRRQILWGIVLIIVGLLVGPGGVSIFT
jgi:hypothetical protein